MTRSIRRLASTVFCVSMVMSLASAAAREPGRGRPSIDSAAPLHSAMRQRIQEIGNQPLLLPDQGTSTYRSKSVSRKQGRQNRAANGKHRLAAAKAAPASGTSATTRQMTTPRYNLRTLVASAGRPAAALSRRSASKKHRRFVMHRGNNNTVRMLRGKLASPDDRTARSSSRDFPGLSRSFIASNRDMFALQDPEKQLKLKREWMDTRGRSHAVFQRRSD